MSHLSEKPLLTVPAEIQACLDRVGMRRTLATRAVLGLFLSHAKTTLSHAQAFGLLQARGLDINRVTLYRLLDRLAACGALERHADDGERTWRFGLANPAEEGSVPRFECDACHQQLRLVDASASTQAVADDLYRQLAALGHQGLRMEVAVHGTCADCVTTLAGATSGGAAP